MHLLHLARRLRFWLELTRVKRCVIIVITIGSLTVQPTSRGQGGCAFRTNCKWCTCTTDARFSWMLLDHWMLLGIPIIASGNMTLESGLRDCVLGSSWFIISAFVHHFCKQNGVDARLDSKHSPGQAECWKPRESVKSYRCSKKIHSRKRISLQLPTYEIDINWLKLTSFRFTNLSICILHPCLWNTDIYSTDSTWISPFSQPNLHASSLPTERSVTWWILMVHCQKASPGWSNQMHLASLGEEPFRC